MSEDFPPQPKTQELPAADPVAVQFNELKLLIVTGLGALDARVGMGFRDLDTKVDRLEANLELQGGELGLVKKEVGLLFDWKGDVDTRLKNNSQRARAPSSFDMDQDAKLAQALSQLVEEKEKREKLEANAATKADLEAITKAQTSAIVEGIKGVETLAARSPVVRGLLLALAGLVFVALNAATTYLTTKGH